VVGVRRLLLCAIVLVLFCVQYAWAAKQDGDGTYTSAEEVFASVAKDKAPDAGGESAEDILARMYSEPKVDEGTYPPSEFWSHDLDLRRTKPPELGYHGRFFYKYSKDDISKIEKWEREEELSLNYKNWDAFFRYTDYTPFADRKKPMRLTKAQLRYSNDDVKVTLGSFGGVFGRGLALNMLDDRPVDFDNEAEGVKIEYNLGKTELTALYGTRKDRSQQRNSEVEGARIAVPLGNHVTIGAHTVMTKFPDLTYTAANPVLLDYDLYGGDLTVQKGPISLYAETVRLQRSKVANAIEKWDVDGQEGKGYYLNLGFTWPGFSISGEYKDYQGLQQPFSVLPPLRRFNELSKAEPNDDVGYLVTTNWSPNRGKDDSFVTASYGQSNPHTQVYPYTELNIAYSSRSDRKQTWVPEFWRIDINGTLRDIFRLTTSRKLSDDWTASAYYEHERYNPVYSQGFVDFIYEGELAYQSKFNITYTQEETGQPLAADRTYWKLWELKIKPDERQEINIVTGSRRAGFVCSGGVCRQEPMFSGLRVDYVFRF
jgi:hypothetical protein